MPIGKAFKKSHAFLTTPHFNRKIRREARRPARRHMGTHRRGEVYGYGEDASVIQPQARKLVLTGATQTRYYPKNLVVTANLGRAVSSTPNRLLCNRLWTGIPETSIPDDRTQTPDKKWKLPGRRICRFGGGGGGGGEEVDVNVRNTFQVPRYRLSLQSRPSDSGALDLLYLVTERCLDSITVAVHFIAYFRITWMYFTQKVVP